VTDDEIADAITARVWEVVEPEFDRLVALARNLNERNEALQAEVDERDAMLTRVADFLDGEVRDAINKPAARARAMTARKMAKTDDLAKRAKALQKQGRTRQEIAEEIDRTERTVYNLLGRTIKA
jgi:DNA-binding CsgD family transcriptional regulator